MRQHLLQVSCLLLQEKFVKTAQTSLRTGGWGKKKKRVSLENSCASLTPRPHSCVFCCIHDKVCVPGCALALEILQTLLEPSRTCKGRLSLFCALARLQVPQFSTAMLAAGMLKQIYVQFWIWWERRLLFFFFLRPRGYILVAVIQV